MNARSQMSRSVAVRAAAIALAVGALPAASFAQPWPTKPIRAIIPITAAARQISSRARFLSTWPASSDSRSWSITDPGPAAP
jgi:hypothetical protein